MCDSDDDAANTRLLDVVVEPRAHYREVTAQRHAGAEGVARLSIAAEKLGLLKPDVPFFCAVEDDYVQELVAEIAEETGWDGLFVWEPVWGGDAWISCDEVMVFE